MNNRKLKQPNKSLRFLIILFISFTFISSQAQDFEQLSVEWKNLVSNTGAMPFWFHQQQYGAVDPTSANSVIGFKYQSGYSWKVFRFTPLVDITTRISKNKALYFNQLALKTQWNGFIMQGGRFSDPLTQSQSSLSTGSFIISRNATPMPKVAVYTDDYIVIPGTAGIVAFDALIAHGWFENNRYTRNAYLHQKYFYLRLNYKWISGYGGIVHYSQWAGRNESYGQLPNTFKAFLETVFAVGSTDKEAPMGEQTNAAGNSIAAYDFGIKIRRDNFWMDVQRLFYLEDKVSTRFRSPWDGMWTARIRTRKTEVLYEHINTKRQDRFDFEPWGTANYYNHGIYLSGWTYNQRVLGNSLILANTNLEKPIYNNIIVAHHFGLELAPSPTLKTVFKYTFSRNYGIVTDQIIKRYENNPIRGEYYPLSELKKVNHSLFLEIMNSPKQLQPLSFGILLAADVGELYDEHRFGFGFVMRYATNTSSRK